MKKSWVIVLALAVGAIPIVAQADCTITLNVGKRNTLSWDPVPDADTYILEESTDNFRTSRRWEWNDKAPSQLFREVSYTSTTDLRVKYRLTATGGTAFTPCSDTKEIIFPANRAFKNRVQKSVIPLVGSTPGLNGSQFKTSLRLRATKDDQRGNLVLRRLNVPGTNRDWSIPYSLSKKGDVLYFEDVVAEFGYVGLGSLDIIPDPSAGGGATVPFAEVRLFNVANAGTFGTIESQTQPFAWNDDLLEPGAYRFTVVVPDESMRLNIGVRAFRGSIVMAAVSRNGKNLGTQAHTPSEDSVIFMPAQAFVGNLELRPGDVIRIFGQGDFVPMYSLTDNRTNDPALFVPPTRVDFDLTSYAIPD